MGPLLLLLTLSSAAAPRIVVLDVKPRVGVTTDLAQGITDDVVIEVRRRAPKGTTIVSSEEIRSTLGFEQQRQKLGCQETSCLAEIGGAMGADAIVIGTLGKFGATYLLSLQLVETRGAKVKQQASIKIDGKSDDALLEAVGKAVEQLFPGAVATAPAAGPAPAAAVTAPPPGPPRSHVARWTFVGVGGAALIGAAISGGIVLSYLSFNNGIPSDAGTTSIASAQSQRSTANTLGTVGLVLAGVAVGCGVGAALTW